MRPPRANCNAAFMSRGPKQGGVYEAANGWADNGQCRNIFDYFLDKPNKALHARLPCVPYPS
jgi:hypothetical protein